tara:strand:- start:1845 stop:2039 length:195 start_codon:yes stop_codon:yes gene_type:complete
MKKRRTLEETEILRDKIVKHYFNNPDKNSYKEIINRFSVCESFIRDALSCELEKRFKNKQCIKE